MFYIPILATLHFLQAVSVGLVVRYIYEQYIKPVFGS